MSLTLLRERLVLRLLGLLTDINLGLLSHNRLCGGGLCHRNQKNGGEMLKRKEVNQPSFGMIFFFGHATSLGEKIHRSASNQQVNSQIFPRTWRTDVET
jgi:hypothetical protein